MIAWLLALFGCRKPHAPKLDLPPLDRASDVKLFYPVLRNYDPSDLYAQSIVHRPIADGLAVFACRRISRPEGRVGIDYVLKRNLTIYGKTEDEIMRACYTNLFADHIQVDVREQGNSRLFQLTSSGHLVAGILGREGTYKQFAEMTPSTSVAILIMSPEMISVTAVGSSFENGLHNIAQEMRAQGGAIDLTPSVYYWRPDGKLLTTPEWRQQSAGAERGSQAH